MLTVATGSSRSPWQHVAYAILGNCSMCHRWQHTPYAIFGNIQLCHQWQQASYALWGTDGPRRPPLAAARPSRTQARIAPEVNTARGHSELSVASRARHAGNIVRINMYSSSSIYPHARNAPAGVLAAPARPGARTVRSVHICIHTYMRVHPYSYRLRPGASSSAACSTH